MFLQKHLELTTAGMPLLSEEGLAPLAWLHTRLDLTDLHTKSRATMTSASIPLLLLAINLPAFLI
jgi:hypothetical protein